MRTIGNLKGATIRASDGDIGSVMEVYFDDEAWAIRYLVVDAGSWLNQRKVLISPYSVRLEPGEPGGVASIDVALTRGQVKNSPLIDTHKPISRQHERETLGYYGHPMYWGGPGLWAMGSVPVMPLLVSPTQLTTAEQERGVAENRIPEEDVHLRSSDTVKGYDIAESDGSIGDVKDFLFDESSWAIRYLIIDTGNWWPGKRVLVSTRWIDRIDWTESKIYTQLSRSAIKASPEYDERSPPDRDCEMRLHETHGRQGYW
jgi:uncharacterized protein YrrD